MIKIIKIILIILVVNCSLSAQSVTAFAENDTVYYKLDREAALNLIFHARRGMILPSVIDANKKVMDSVLEAKKASDRAQMTLQTEVSELKLRLLNTEKELIRERQLNEKLNNVKNKVDKQRNTILGFSIGMLTLFLITM